MKFVCFIGVSLLIILGSCTQQMNKKIPAPADLIQRDTLVDIIVDFRLYEGAIAYEQRTGKRNLHDRKYYLHNSVLEKHKITREQFERSYEYYQQDKLLFDEIYADAITKLSVLKSKINTEN